MKSYKKMTALLLALAVAVSSALSAGAAEAYNTQGTIEEESVLQEEFANQEEIIPAKETDVAATGAQTDAPEITQVQTVSNGLKITWTSYPGAAKYRLFVKNPTDSAKAWSKVADTADTVYTHLGLTSNVEYIYTVRALDCNKQYISGFDPQGYAFTYYAAPVLSAAESVYGGVKLTWNAVTGAPLYRVYRKSGTEWVHCAYTAETSFTDTNTAAGAYYTYTVRVCSADKKTMLSFYNKTGLSVRYVEAPTVSGFGTISGGTTINWKAVEGASKYRLFVKNTSGSGKAWLKVGDTTGLNMEHNNLSNGVTYTYTLRAMDHSGGYISGNHPTGWQRTYYDAPKIDSVEYKNGVYTLMIIPQDGVYGYRVYRRAFGGGWTEAGVTCSPYFIDSHIDAGTLYSYTVRCINKSRQNISYFEDTGLYYDKGTLADGDYTYNGTNYHFAQGHLRKGYQTIDGKLYYFNSSGKLLKDGIVGSKSEGYTYADKNGVCCISEEIKLAANFMMTHGTGKTRKEKMKTSFLYMAKYCPYNRTYDHPKSAADLAPLAIDLFKKEKGNCFRYAAAFTCIAKIAGYRTRTVIGATGSYGSPHGWTEVLVDGKWLICDVDAQIPTYRQADYAAYMMTYHYWSLTPYQKCELIIDDNGNAYWQ